MLSVIFIKEVMDMSTQSDFLDAMEILIKERAKPGTLIYTGKVETVDGVFCTVLVNGQVKQMPWFGNVSPKVDNTYKVYVPQGEFSSAYLLNVESLVNNIVEEGQTEDGWTWRKWKNGEAECWKTEIVTGSIDQAWGSLYIGCYSRASLSYPAGVFDKTPVEIVSLSVEGEDAVILTTMEKNTTYQAGRYAAVRAETLAPATVIYNYYAHT